MKNTLKQLLSPESLSVLSFIILVFLSFIPTNDPWAIKSEDYFDRENSNIINQIQYSSLFFLSLLVIIPKFERVTNFIIKEKFLSLFIVLCLISSLWAEQSLTSLKRSFQLGVVFIVILNSIIFIDIKKLFKIIRLVVTLYIVITFLALIFIPEAIDPAFDTWRGLHTLKNGLGQFGVLCFILSLAFFNSFGGLASKIWNYTLILLSVILVLGAMSSTSIIVLFLLVLSIFIFKIEEVYRPIRIGRIFPIVIFLFSISLFILVFVYFGELLGVIPELFNKDLTLTGRTLFWGNLIEEVERNLFLGYGYANYWIIGSPRIYKLFSDIDWMFNSAHNGFIEIALQLGLLGILFLLFFFGSFLKRTLILKDNVALLFFLSLFIGNLTESNLLAARSATTVILIFFYLKTSKFYFLYREKNEYSSQIF